MPISSHGDARSRLFWAAVWLSAYSVFFACFSIHLGGDATPDFRLYHFYNGFAAFSGGRPQDIGAAQLQTYFFPLSDVVYFAFIRLLNNWPKISDIIFSIPTIVAAFLTYLIALRIVPQNWRLRHLIAGLLALFGCVGASSLPTLATSMSEWVAGVFALAALWICLTGRQHGSLVIAAGAGVAAGIAVGLKLTCLPFFLGLFVAIGITEISKPMGAVARVGVFGATGLVAFCAVSGWWWLHLYQIYGNPIFPSYNDIFKSDYVPADRFTDPRFKPTSLVMALFYPVYWAFAETQLVIELNMKDAHILIGTVASLMILCGAFFRRFWPIPFRKADAFYVHIFLAIFFITSYAAWEILFSIYRYLSVLEALCGIVALSATIVFFAGFLRGVAAVALSAILIGCVWFIHYPWWSRSSQTAHIIEATVPQMSPDSIVLILDNDAYSWIVRFFPPSVSVFGANTNMISPGAAGRFQALMEARVKTQRGPIYGLENSHDYPHDAEAVLKYYRLKRAQCSVIETNIDDPNTKICRLDRTD